MNTRRTLIKTAAALAGGFPTIVKASALGLEGALPASDRVALGCIGLGWMGFDGHIKDFCRTKEARIVAVADIYDEHLTRGKAWVDTAYGDQGCAAYYAFEELLLRRDIDAVSIAVPDHWHGLIATQAARARKDIYCEKPLAHNFHEGLMMVEAARKYGRVWQTGSWQRSVPNFVQACELVRNGRLGKIKAVEVGLPGGHYKLKDPVAMMKATDPPPTLRYDRWLGPAPEAPYCEARVHVNWRWNYDYAGGQLMDWVGHHIDIAHWGMGWDDTGPVTVEGTGEFPPRTDLFNTATKYRVNCVYTDGTPFTIAGGHADIRSGTKWIGERGWIWVDRGKLEAEPKSLLEEKIGENETRLKNNGGARGHYAEFIEAVKTRGKTLTPAEVALHSAVPGWLGNIAMITGRKLKWDPVKMEILGDPAAAKMLRRDMRWPYQL